jgi:pimeloyl-ACP methyl ester carboxylesterase
MMTVPPSRYDWGQQSSRWVGIHSNSVTIGGSPAHFLRADPDSSAVPGAATQLLVHPMGAGSWSWLDVIKPLSSWGSVVAPDLPGSGWTPAPRRGAPRADQSARFLASLLDDLRIERVVVHGLSLGGLVALLLAELAPDRTERLILTSPALAAKADSPRQRLMYQTIGRLGLFVAPPIVRPVARASLRSKAAAWRRWREDPSRVERTIGRIGADPSRISPELFALILYEIDQFRKIPWRLDSGVSAMASAVRLMTLDQPMVGEMIDRVAAPTLLLWGDRDRVIPRVMVDDLVTRRPEWRLRVLEGVGHLAPWEAPEAYADAVDEWLAAES